MPKYSSYKLKPLEEKQTILKEIYLTSTVLFLTIINALYSLIYLIIQFKTFSIHKIFYLIASYFLFQGFVTYLLCRLGYWKRKFLYSIVTQEEVDDFAHTNNPPIITYLIPSYKEDPIIIKQSILSA